MSRLIDADAITRTKKLNNKIKVIDMTPYISLEDLIEFIDNLPTVYDVEKVVEELEDYREELKRFGAEGMLPDMIEVVRKGGVE